MKFRTEPLSAKVERLSEWHRFFALLPYEVQPGDWRWLEFIERRGRRYGDGFFVRRFWVWEFRARSKS